MKKPIILPLTKSFFRDCQKMTLIAMTNQGNKHKKIAKGEINLYKKYFLGEKNTLEKWIYLNLFEKKIDQKGISSDIIKTGLNS